MIRKFLAKVDEVEAWQVGNEIHILVSKHADPICIERTQFFLVEKLMGKVIRGFLNGD